MRGPSERARIDTNMQYTAPMTVMTFRSDDRNIWKTKEKHWCMFSRVPGLFRDSAAHADFWPTAAGLWCPCGPRSLRSPFD